MPMDKYHALPVATAQDILSMAKNLAEVLKRPVNDAMIDKAVEEMLDTHQIDQIAHDDAKMLLLLEQKPDALLFENANVKFIGFVGTEYWMSIKKMGHETTLADYRDFINAMIEQFGADRRFYATSDHGDEYFNLVLKKRD